MILYLIQKAKKVMPSSCGIGDTFFTHMAVIVYLSTNGDLVSKHIERDTIRLEIYSIIHLVSLFSGLGGNKIFSSVNFGWNVWCLFPTLGARKNPISSHWTEKKKQHLHSLSIALWVILQQLIFFSHTLTIYCVIMKGFCTK